MMRWDRVRYKVNLYRRYPYWKNRGVIFIHVPKAAGTSINRALYGRTLGHYTAHEIESRFPGLFNSAFVFSFVRNPWDRALSAYRFAKFGRTELMGIARPEKYKISAFESFEAFLFEWLVVQDFDDIDFVFQPQNRFVCRDDFSDRLMVDFLGKVENIKSDMERVSQKVGETIRVSRSNVTGRGFDFRKEYQSSEMIDLVYKLYKKDIELFGYSFE